MISVNCPGENAAKRCMVLARASSYARALLRALRCSDPRSLQQCSLTPIRMWVVVWGPSGAEHWEFRRVWHRPPTAASRERPSLPSVCRKKNGHLQVCILDMLSSIGNSRRDPQVLGNHSSDTQDITVKHPRLIGKVDDEKAAVCPKPKRGRMALNGLCSSECGRTAAQLTWGRNYGICSAETGRLASVYDRIICKNDLTCLEPCPEEDPLLWP